MLRKALPILEWLPTYRRSDLAGDVTAGLIVAIMLVPQGMAYAMLGGLPPEVGLYASILPPLLYALFGTSRALAVGPVAIASLMTATAIGDAASLGLGATDAALLLALMSGVMLVVMGVLRVGFLVNFLGHPVISGFTSAAAVIIAFSQLKDLTGVAIPRTHHIHEVVIALGERFAEINWTTVAISAGAIAILLLSRGPLGRLMGRAGLGASIAGPLTKTGPLMVVALGAVAVALGSLETSAGVRVVGAIPAGLPSPTLASLDPAVWIAMAPAAFLIALIGYLESVSVAKALAGRRRQKIEPNQELYALGAANIGAAFTGGYPVAGGFGRSSVNFSSGANTPLASAITAVLIGLTLLFLTPLFHDLPRAVLAAIIVIAVAGLIDFRTLTLTWRYNKADAASLIATFAAVLILGVELGLAAGAGLAIVLYLYRTSQPHMAVVGRVGNTEHFRNVRRHTVRTVPSILAVRVDESLYFANSRYLEDHVLARVAEQPEVRHLVLICSAVNAIDSSALETLERLIEQLREAGVTVHLAEIKGPVMDRLLRTDFLDRLAPGRIFLSTHNAVDALEAEAAAAPAPDGDARPAA